MPKAPAHAGKNERLPLLFASVAHNGVFVTKTQFLDLMRKSGVLPTDTRVAQTMVNLAHYGDNDELDYRKFAAVVRDNGIMIERILQGSFVITKFGEFTDDIVSIFEQTRKNTTGQVASYIPQLGRVDPDRWGLAITTIDGQQLALGDADMDFCVQSTSKPINYCIALDLVGEEKVHSHIGHEPSGHGFNNLALDKNNKPHNPMINAGAIMCCALIKHGNSAADRFEYVMNVWSQLAGSRVKFDNAVYLSERATADRNFALAYFMREHHVFPPNVDLHDILEFYFQCCSIQVTARQMSVVAATLASGGINPYTGKRVFKQSTVKHCLSLMYSCGMYDFSGEFAFHVGLPAKSGVSGVLLVVVPNVMGFAVYSPRLDSMGNSVRGVEFCSRLVQHFNFHNYDTMGGSNKKDPRRSNQHGLSDKVGRLLNAAQQGDFTEIQHQFAHGVNLGITDYDGRTALHIACCEGQLNIVKFLVQNGVSVDVKDRWGHTPLSEAQANRQTEVIDFLLECAAATTAAHHRDTSTNPAPS